MNEKTALITGVAGQDGTYLTELLLSKGYRIVGTSREEAAAAEKRLAPHLRGKVELTRWDFRDEQQMRAILMQYRPQEIYNFGGYSSGAGMFDDPAGIGEINGLAVTRLVEAMRQVDVRIRLCQASSSEMFGEPLTHPQSESTPFRPRSPYGAAKLYAHSMLRIYRQKYGLYACSAILFNHESPRRGREFVTRKICHEAARIKLGLASELPLGNLDVLRDWGYSADYVHAMWLMLQQAKADDYVLSTGKLHTVGQFCDYAFSHLGLDYRNYVRVDPSFFRPAEPVPLVGDSSHAQAKLGWHPTVNLQQMVSMMVDAEMAALQES